MLPLRLIHLLIHRCPIPFGAPVFILMHFFGACLKKCVPQVNLDIRFQEKEVLITTQSMKPIPCPVAFRSVVREQAVGVKVDLSCRIKAC
ncbi:hypothetical protein AVEN_82447-1 [Araneus ventricosus]|uniref:Uncharacterized protein n=1 Tax=Araneus ventricosus TaxID=182803 RepID=A0A4Y2HTT5_ARAVE|nr:hypothetical protein AVEN_82447-1 [Araneus ventricosus]